MLNQTFDKNSSSKGLGDIVDFVKSDSFSLSEFRRKQRTLLEAGATNTHPEGILVCDGDNIEHCTCPDCKSRLVSFNYRLGGNRSVLEWEFQGCLNCWQFWTVMPVYENFNPQRDDIFKKLELLNDHQYLMVALFVKTLMD